MYIGYVYENFLNFLKDITFICGGAIFALIVCFLILSVFTIEDEQKDSFKQTIKVIKRILTYTVTAYLVLRIVLIFLPV